MLGIHLTSRDRKRIHEILKTYQVQKEISRRQKFVQHGHTSTYQHSMNVVRLSYWLNKHFHLHADEKALLVGALLHDFYLYDWHEKSTWHRWHGFSILSGRQEMPERFSKSTKKKNTLSKATCGR